MKVKSAPWFGLWWEFDKSLVALTSFGNLMFNSFMINYEKVKITFYGLWIAWGRLTKNINEISGIFHREEGRGSTHSTKIIYFVPETDPNTLKHEINQLECLPIVTCLTVRDPNYRWLASKAKTEAKAKPMFAIWIQNFNTKAKPIIVHFKGYQQNNQTSWGGAVPSKICI